MTDQPVPVGEDAPLFEVMRTLRDAGVAILFVTHFLDQVFEISDCMTVLQVPLTREEIYDHLG